MRCKIDRKRFLDNMYNHIDKDRLVAPELVAYHNGVTKWLLDNVEDYDITYFVVSNTMYYTLKFPVDAYVEGHGLIEEIVFYLEINRNKIVDCNEIIYVYSSNYKNHSYPFLLMPDGEKEDYKSLYKMLYGCGDLYSVNENNGIV